MDTNNKTFEEGVKEEFEEKFNVGSFDNYLERVSPKEITDFFLSKFSAHNAEVIKKIEIETRLAIFEMLHTEAMKTKDISALDLIEKLQNNVLSSKS